MKQTVEEAAKEYYEGNNYTPFISTIMNDLNISHNKVDVESIRQHHLKKGFIAGAEWQAKQAPWISVKERLPEELESVLVLSNYEGKYLYEVAFIMNGKWICHNNKPAYWTPIPSFDEILEANRDVLERIKEKGD